MAVAVVVAVVCQTKGMKATVAVTAVLEVERKTGREGRVLGGEGKVPGRPLSHLSFCVGAINHLNKGYYMYYCYRLLCIPPVRTLKN